MGRATIESIDSIKNLEQRTLLEIIGKFSQGLFDEVTRLADSHYATQNHITSITQELARIRVVAPLKLNCKADATACIAELFINAPQRLLGEIEPYIRLIASDSNPPADDVTECIDFAIMLCAAQQLGSDIKDFQIYAAYDRLLKILGLRLPTDLIENQTFIENRWSREFLFYCCKLEFLKSSKYITGTTQLESERLQLLQHIQANSPVLSSECRHEISKLSKIATLRKALLQVEASKIYVNVDLVIATLPDDSESEFDRFVRYSELENIHGKKRFREDSENNYDLVISFLNDAFKLYAELFGRVRDAFVFSKAGGLQTYLSMRVRHGSLEAHLRGQLEKTGLMTRLLDDGEYSPNETWEDEFGIVRSDISIVLTEFAKDFDSLLRRVNADWISVVRDASPETGMFDFRFTPHDLAAGYLQWRILGNKAYEQFLRHCFNELWERTEVCLSRIRERIRSELRVDLMATLLRLQEKVEKLEQDSVTRMLRAKIAMSTTQMQLDIDSLASWFNTVQSITLTAFNLDLLLDTCIQIARKVYPNTLVDIRPEITMDIDIDGRWFNAFVDVLDILLLNAVRYSPQEGADVVLQMVADKDELIFSIRNKLHAEIDVEATKKKVLELSTDSEHFLLEDRVQVEGNSGYSKLWNVMTTDLACIGFVIQCSVANDSEFVASVRMPIRKYLLGAKNENPDN